MKVIAVLPQGLEALGAEELSLFGAKDIKTLKRCVSFEADMSCFYRLHLRASLPFRFLREVARFYCSSPEELYLGVQKSLDWSEWLPPSSSFKVNVTGISSGFNHSHFTALKVKNAIIDLQRRLWGERSEIDLNTPDICVHIHLSNQLVILSFATSSESLHRRGYRPAMGIAPLKENLAAGLIRLADWDYQCPLVDPLCGSGTLLIEAVNLALSRAPGLSKRFLFKGWPDFSESIWNQEKDIACSLEKKEIELPPIIGCEQDFNIADNAMTNIRSSGLEDKINIKVNHFRDIDLPSTQGLLVCNPPYGKRIGAEEDLSNLYRELGLFLKEKASGWDFWILSGNPNLTKFLRMKANKRVPISNGGIDCRWLNYSIR